MNNIETERVTYEEFMTMFKFAPRMCYTLYDKAEDEITQLTNNWNELEKELKEYLDRLEYCAHSVDVFYSNAICNDITNILDKMKEIKEGKDND